MVLVTGGYDGSGYLSSAEYFDIAEGVWNYTANLNQVKRHHTATLLPDGKVLVAGGDTVGAVGS